MKKVVLLGSTGSIGTQALDVIRLHPDRFEALTLTAGSNAELLVRQAREFRPDSVVIADETKYPAVKEALSDLPVKVYAGAEALCGVAEAASADIVLAAMVGFAGLRPTVRAIKAGKIIALANKETLVVAGELMTRLAKQHRAPILPVDSEHSAIFQCIVGEAGNEIAEILLTASGGPFRTWDKEKIASATCAEALRHPSWKMGAKITVDSATMMNKGFEVIEARWLFDVPAERIRVVVHPESVVHSAVVFVDGAVKAQLGTPDMRLPIQYAFSFPHRLPLCPKGGEALSLTRLGALHFEEPRRDCFPCLALAREALKTGGTAPCILNAANEVANAAFRAGQIAFADLPRIIESTLAALPAVPLDNFEQLPATDTAARAYARQKLCDRPIASNH